MQCCGEGLSYQGISKRLFHIRASVQDPHGTDWRGKTTGLTDTKARSCSCSQKKRVTAGKKTKKSHLRQKYSGVSFPDFSSVDPIYQPLSHTQPSSFTAHFPWKKHVSWRDDSLGDIAGATGGERMINRKHKKRSWCPYREETELKEKNTGISEVDSMVVNWQLNRRKHAIPPESFDILEQKVKTKKKKKTKNKTVWTLMNERSKKLSEEQSTRRCMGAKKKWGKSVNKNWGRVGGWSTEKHVYSAFTCSPKSVRCVESSSGARVAPRCCNKSWKTHTHTV